MRIIDSQNRAIEEYEINKNRFNNDTCGIFNDRNE